MSGDDPNKTKRATGADSFRETQDFSATTDINQIDAGNQTLANDKTIRAEWFQSQGGTTIRNPTSDESSLPSDIPGFAVERELGRGAFGVVYAAHDEMLERKVAIKKPLISDPIHRQQYIDEARKAVKLEHPGIVPIYHVGTTTGGEPFVVQKLIEGSSLRGLIKSSDKRLPMIQIISIIRQVCMAVDAAHAAGIVHRDLKPENLLVAPEGRVYVADFGLAIVEDDEQVSKGREIAGTPYYMSPEQYTGRNEWLDGRSDIWAIGVILYELLSGKPPFSGRSLAELKDEIRNKDPRPIHQRDPNIPPSFDALFRKCCAKQVADRFASVHELLAELDEICKTLTLNPADWEMLSRTGAASGLLSRTGASFDTALDTLTTRGVSTQRSMSTTARSTMRGSILREPSLVGSVIAPIVATVLTLFAVVVGARFLELGPFASVANAPTSNNSLPPSDPKNALLGDSTEKKPETNESQEIPLPTVPQKPFTVSFNRDGTHDSIAKAIADSAPGDTITIRAGTYRESFILDRSLNIIGEGEVRCVATDKSCMEVRGESEVVVENVRFECQIDERNTIEIFGGKLHLKSCEVFASSRHSFDCVRARSNSIFVAEGCSFQSMEHAAIYGDVDSTIAIRDSKISFPGNRDFGPKRVGIQAFGAKGVFQRCTIVGPCINGIEWHDCPNQELTIEKCKFDNCDVGMLIKNCKAVKIVGSEEEPCELKNVRFGINLVGSTAVIDRIRVDSSGEKDKVGLQVVKGSNVQCDRGFIRGMQCGVLVNQSELKISNGLEIHDTSFSGLLSDGSNVEADSLGLHGVQQFGLVVLSTKAQVRVDSLVVSGFESSDQKIIPAIYATSGDIQLGQTEIRHCLCALCVDPDRKIIEEVGYPKQSILAELLPTKKSSDQPQPVIQGRRMLLEDCDMIWTFAGTGTSKIDEIVSDLPRDQRDPRILFPDELERVGDDFSDFSVIRKASKK